MQPSLPFVSNMLEMVTGVRTCGVSPFCARDAANEVEPTADEDLSFDTDEAGDVSSTASSSGNTRSATSSMPRARQPAEGDCGGDWSCTQAS